MNKSENSTFERIYFPSCTNSKRRPSGTNGWSDTGILTDVVFAGICARDIELVQLSTGKPALDKLRNVAVDDRFKLRVPVSDQYVTWEVYFNCSLPNCPPDFDLNDLEFFYSITLDSMEELLPSLNDWDHRKEKALINVISELRSAYLKYQVEKIQTVDNCCAFEFTSLAKEIPADQIEVFVDGSAIHFLIKLDVDFKIILPPEDQLNPLLPDDCIVLLSVRYGGLRMATLITTPEATKLIGDTLDLPRNIRSEDRLCDYVKEVSCSIDNQLVTIQQQHLNQRKAFLFDLLKRLGSSIIHYDAIHYHSAAALLEQRGFVCLLEVTLSPLFPVQVPRYRLISTYGTGSTHPFTQQLNLGEVGTNVNLALNTIEARLQAFKQCVMATFKSTN